MMNVGLGIGDIILGNEPSMVEALLIVILVIWVPFWIYKAYTNRKIKEFVYDRIVNSWYFNQEIRNGYYRCKFDIDPSKSIKIYDKEECDRSRPLQNQYEYYKREAIYLPRPFVDEEYWDGIMIGKYGGRVLNPVGGMTKGDYWFATFNGVEINKHIWEVEMDSKIIDAVCWYIKAIKTVYKAREINKNSLFVKLLKEAERAAEKLIYGIKSDEEWFYKICFIIDVILVEKLYEEERVEEVVKKFTEINNELNGRIDFYYEACCYLKEYMEKTGEGIITAEPVQAVPDPEEPDAAPVQSDAEGEFAEQILAELIEEGFTGDELLSEFKKRQAKVKPAVESVLSEAKEIAHGRGAYSTYEDVFGAGEKQR